MGFIQNTGQLATTPARADALKILEAGYAAIDVRRAIETRVRIDGDDVVVDEVRRPLRGRRIFFVGVGKCAFAAAAAAETVFGEKLSGGLALDVHAPEMKNTGRIELLEGTHPHPSETNAAATRRILDALRTLPENTLVVTLISGGGSTLLCAPQTPMTVDDERVIFDLLTEKGASIQELNTVRKHLSNARGGGLAAAAFPAEVISLIVSDVPGNDIAYVSSGPTVLDTSTEADTRAVFARYAVEPPAETTFLETPKDPSIFANVTNTLFITNHEALAAMRDTASALGYSARIENDRFAGEAGGLARSFAQKLHDAPAKTALLFAGESTVTLGTAAGNGGRNQELALAALEELRDDELVVAAASDGCDATDHAGAIADATTRTHAREKNLDPVDYRSRHASYDFFDGSGDALVTGTLESNVSDLVLALKN